MYKPKATLLLDAKFFVPVPVPCQNGGGAPFYLFYEVKNDKKSEIKFEPKLCGRVNLLGKCRPISGQHSTTIRYALRRASFRQTNCLCKLFCDFSVSVAGFSSVEWSIFDQIKK